MFQAVSKGAVATKLTTLQNIRLHADESIIEYSNRIFKFVIQLECTGHDRSKIEQKHALLGGLPTDFVVTAESKMAAEYGFNEAVSKSIVLQSLINYTEVKTEIAMCLCVIGCLRGNVLYAETPVIWRLISGRMKGMAGDRTL